MPTRIATAFAALAAASCNTTGPIYMLGEGEAYAVVVGLAEMAQAAGDGASTHPCPLGGKAAVHVTTTSGLRGDSVVTSGRWAVAPAECVMGVTISGKPEVVFSSEVTVPEQGAARIVASIKGAIHWRGREGGSSCSFDLSLETTETDFDGAFTGTLAGPACGGTVVPLSAVGFLRLAGQPASLQHSGP